MEVQVYVDGKLKTFKEDKINFLTIRKALEWHEELSAQFDLFQELAEKGIDGEIDKALEDRVRRLGEKDILNMACDLITAFFKDHFTYDDFVTGCYFHSIEDIYAMANDIVELALNMKDESEKK